MAAEIAQGTVMDVLQQIMSKIQTLSDEVADLKRRRTAAQANPLNDIPDGSEIKIFTHKFNDRTIDVAVGPADADTAPIIRMSFNEALAFIRAINRGEENELVALNQYKVVHTRTAKLRQNEELGLAEWVM